MSFYVYKPAAHEFLAIDEHSWTDSLSNAAAFTSRELADAIAEREGGPYDTIVFDDGEL